MLVHLFGKLRRTDFLPVKIKGGCYDDEVRERGVLSQSDDSMDEGIEYMGGSDEKIRRMLAEARAARGLDSDDASDPGYSVRNTCDFG